MFNHRVRVGQAHRVHLTEAHVKQHSRIHAICRLSRMPILHRAALLPLGRLFSATSACSTLEGPQLSDALACGPGAASLESPPGQAWSRATRWRFHSRAEAASAYGALAEKSSPWPDWYRPYQSGLPVGTRFQMAIGGKQTPEMPGASERSTM